MPPLTSAVTVLRGADSTGATDYAAFYDGVARTQLREWLPRERSLILDMSGPDARYAVEAAAAGHQVIHLTQQPGQIAPGVQQVVADPCDVSWLQPESLDAVLAEGGAMSSCLATEDTLARIGRALRPGGRLMMCVDSLVLGLARLAEQQRWAELADVPSADVVLVPTEDGRITRCFWPDELCSVLDEGGFDVEWIRPRTVLSPEAVARALAGDGDALGVLISTEVRLERERAGESIGYHLVVSAVRR
jgi:hypothetical protein